jgi:hypothetical protein
MMVCRVPDLDRVVQAVLPTGFVVAELHKKDGGHGTEGRVLQRNSDARRAAAHDAQVKDPTLCLGW